MRYFLFFLLVFPSFLFSQEADKITELYKPICPLEGPDEILHKKALYPTVKITSETSESCGSGFIVKSEKNVNYFKDKYVNVVVTANHVVDGKLASIIHVPKYKDWSEIDGFEEYPSIIAYSHPAQDIAILLFASPEQLPVADLDLESNLFFGTEIFKIGYGIGDDVRIDYGHITSVKTKIPDAMKRYMRTNAYTIFGDSGGPVFTKKYKVTGITHAIRGTPNGGALYSQSYISSISFLKEWNKDINNAVEFVYKSEGDFPLTATYQLWLKDYKITGNRK